MRSPALCLLLPALLGLCLFFPAASAPAASRGPLEVPIFTGGFGAGFYLQTARDYEAAHPGRSVRLYGDPRIANRLRVRILGGDDPDLTDAELPWPELIAAGRVLDLRAALLEPSPYAGGRPWGQTFLPGALDRWTLPGGQTYAVPFAHAIVAVFYNKGLFRREGWSVPATWDDFFALNAAIRARGLAPLALPGLYARYIDNFLRAAHYQLAGPDGVRSYYELAPGARLQPAFLRAAEVVQRLAREDLQPGWEGMSHTAAQLEFFQGRAAMVCTGSWLVAEMAGSIPPDFELGAFNFPLFPDSLVPASHIQTGSGYYFVFAGSPRRDEAIDFLRFLTAPANAERFARERDAASALAGLDPALFSPRMRDAAALVAASTGSYGQPPGTATLFPRLNQDMTDLRLDLLSGRLTPAQFGSALEARAAALRAEAAARHPAGPHPGAAAPAGSVLPARPAHLGRGLLLLSFLLAVFSFALWRRPGGAGPAAQAARENHFGPLQPRLLVLFVLPAFSLYFLFLLWPALSAVGWSLLEWNGLDRVSWAGLRHFSWLLFSSDTFGEAIGNNLFLMFVPGAVILPAATVFAYWIHRCVPGGAWFRIGFLFPNILGGVAATLLWLAAYDPATGLINAFLTSLGSALQSLGWESAGEALLGFERFAWLAPERLYPAMVPILLWQGCGFNLVLLTAAMDGIDPQYYEAAEMEGAGLARQFFLITLPLIRDALLTVLVFWLIAGLNAFELVWLLSGQEPASSSHVLGTWMVSTLFYEFRVGRSAAIAVLLFLLVLAGAALLWKTVRREAVER